MQNKMQERVNKKLKIASTGFTLIEILVTTVIFVIILVSLNEVLVTIFRGASKQEVSAQVKQEAENVVGIISRQLRNARSVSCSSQNSTVSYTNPDDSTGSFVCEGGMLKKGEISLTSNAVKVSSCEFTCYGRIVEMNFEFQDRFSAGNQNLPPEEQAVYSVSTRVTLRNQ